jgi:hypothetical protein
LEEDYQPLSERLEDLKAAALAKKQQKGKQSAEKTVVSSSLRRSSRLKGKWKKTKGEQSHIIDLSEEILEKSPEQPSLDISPPREESPFRQEGAGSPPPQDFEFKQRKSPDVDPNQQEV